jgi:hypothetical protein
MRSLLALVVSFALVLGALWVHGDLDDGGSGSSEGGAAPRLLCASELADVCEAIARSADVEIVLEPAGTSVSRLATLPDDEARNPGFDGWLAPAPAAEIVHDARKRAQLAPLLTDGSALASSRLLLAVWKDRERVLNERCSGKIDWRCIGDVAGTPWDDIGGQTAWGNVKLGHANPEQTVIGLDIIGQAASQYFGRTTLSTIDFEDDGFLDWFARLERSVRPSFGNTPFEQMLTAGPGAFEVVGTTQAEARPLLDRASRDRKRNVTLTYPEPVARVDVAFVGIAGSSRASDLSDIVGDAGRAALERAGWDPPRPARAPIGPNLPGAGALEALLDTWREVTG